MTQVEETTRAIEGFKALGFFPADYAASESGKVYASGGYWSVLRFPAFPATLPACTIVAVLQQPFHAAYADHQFAMGLEDSDGAPLGLDVQGAFRASPGDDARYGEPGVIPFAVPLYGLRFDRPGDYAFVLKVDGGEIARYAFHVVQVAGSGIVPRGPSPTDF